jgi:hypothetical protein
MLAPQRSSRSSANHIIAKNGASKISKRKGANSLGKFRQRKEPTHPKNDSFQQKNQIRDEKNQKLRKSKSCGKKLDSPAEKPDGFPYKNIAARYVGKRSDPGRGGMQNRNQVGDGSWGSILEVGAYVNNKLWNHVL